MRLFVSVDLPDDLTAAVDDLQAEFAGASGLTLTDSGQAHVTMKFLGDTPEGDLSRVEDAVEAAVDGADVAPFEARLGGVGAFPSTDYIRVVWLGVRDGHGAAELTALHEALERETTAIGFDPEDHEFTAHVTLARMNHAGGKELVQEALRRLDPDVGTMRVDELRLTESVLTDEGPEYSTVSRFPL